MTYQPTDAQIQAAFKAYYSTPGGKVPTNNDIRNMLIAAHAAAEPVDTTEFEEALKQAFTDHRWLITTQSRDPYLQKYFDKFTASSKALIDLYVKAASG